MENNNFLSASALAAVTLVIGLLVGSHFVPSAPSVSSQPSANYSCTNGGATGSASPSTSIPGSQASAPSGKFGSGTETSSLAGTTVTSLTDTGASTLTGAVTSNGITNTGNVTTSGSFLSATTLTLGVNAGTFATSTFSGTTSTLSFPGRTCFNILTSTGTRWAMTFDNGAIQSSTGQCDH